MRDAVPQKRLHKQTNIRGLPDEHENLSYVHLALKIYATKRNISGQKKVTIDVLVRLRGFCFLSPTSKAFTELRDLTFMSVNHYATSVFIFI